MKIGTSPIFNTIPADVPKFRGRQQEICEILTMLNQTRLVNILGPPGIGKTAISKVMANHIRDRTKFEDGIIYVGLRGCESAQMFLTRLTLAIQKSAENSGVTLKSIKNQKTIDEAANKNTIEMNKEDERKMMTFITNELHNKDILVILDS